MQLVVGSVEWETHPFAERNCSSLISFFNQQGNAVCSLAIYRALLPLPSDGAACFHPNWFPSSVVYFSMREGLNDYHSVAIVTTHGVRSPSPRAPRIAAVRFT